MPNNVLPISNVVTISVSSPPLGLSNYQINNLAIISKETPLNAVPAAGFFTYLTALQVGQDWGTSSETFLLAQAIFSQPANILSGGGSLIVYPIAGGTSLHDAIAQLSPLVFFGGVMACGWAPTTPEYTAAAVLCATTQTLLAVVSSLLSDLTGGGLFPTLLATTNPFARFIFYSVGAQAARIMAAAYFGIGQSTNFNGSNTTQTLHLKQLVGITPDPAITQSILAEAQACGADVYCNIAGLPEIFTSGANQFWDSIYNQNWLTFALEVAIFNALSTTFTKIPQTETGIAILRQAAIAILQQGVINGYLAPGTWNNSTTFGPGTSMIQNISENGYYVYTSPIATQPQPDRAARKAPLMQIAAKQAGAVQSASVIVYVQP